VKADSDLGLHENEFTGSCNGTRRSPVSRCGTVFPNVVAEAAAVTAVAAKVAVAATAAVAAKVYISISYFLSVCRIPPLSRCGKPC
jgi:hypothetical protein